MKEIKVLGPGCQKCRELMDLTEQAVNELGLECEISKITDIKEIIRFGVMFTPALVIDDEVKLTGRVPSLAEMKRLLG